MNDLIRCKQCIHYDICVIRNNLHQSDNYKHIEEFGCRNFIEKQGVFRIECFSKNLSEIMCALEKQEPRKPEDFYICGKHLCIGSCPICGEDINDEFSYCFNCGQKLDWSVENA